MLPVGKSDNSPGVLSIFQSAFCPSKKASSCNSNKRKHSGNNLSLTTLATTALSKIFGGCFSLWNRLPINSQDDSLFFCSLRRKKAHRGKVGPGWARVDATTCLLI